MSLFLNALKTLADRPEPGFPEVGKENQPNDKKLSEQEISSLEMDSSNEPQAAAPVKAKVEPVLLSKLPAPKELLSQLLEGNQNAPESQPLSTSPTNEEPATASVSPTEPWTNLWQEAVANPTPIEVTPDEPDSPEDIALADLREIAEQTNSSEFKLPEEPATPENELSDSPVAQDSVVAKDDDSECSEQPAAVSGTTEESEEDIDSAEMTSSSSLDEAATAREDKEDAPDSQEIKFTFAPWFEAHGKAGDAGQNPEEAASDPDLSEQSNRPENESESKVCEPAPLKEETQIPTASIEKEAPVEAETSEKSPEKTEETSPSQASSAGQMEVGAGSSKNESYWGSEAFDPYSGMSPVVERTEDVAIEDETVEGNSSANETVSETIDLPASSADLLAETEKEDSESATAEEETWTLYDRTKNDWTENRSTQESQLTEPSKLLEELSTAEAKITLPSDVAKPVNPESELPARPVAAVMSSITSQSVPEIRVTEPYLRLATRLCQSLGAGRPQAIAVAAADRAACKTLNIAQLARALTLVEEGDVLVVQGSESRPELAHQMGVLPSERPRWVNTGGGDLAEKIMCNKKSELAMLPYQSLGSSQIQLVDPLLLARCKRHYALILVETGDLSSEASQSLISQADIGLMTAILHHTPREVASQSAALLRRLGVRISGCILCESRSAA